MIPVAEEKTAASGAARGARPEVEAVTGALHRETCFGWRRTAKLFIWGVNCPTQKCSSHIFKDVAPPETVWFSQVSGFVSFYLRILPVYLQKSVLPSGRMGTLVALDLDSVLLAFGLVIFQFHPELGPQVGV